MKATALMLALAIVPALAAPVPVKARFSPINLQDKANHALDDPLGRGYEGNDLKNLPKGEQKYNDVAFDIGKKLLTSRSKYTPNLPAKFEGIEINQKCDKLHFLQACTFGKGAEGDPMHCPDGTDIGEYVVRYADDSTAKIPITYGKHLRDWGDGKDGKVTDAKIGWKGDNDFFKARNSEIGIYQSAWTNPHPDRKIKSLDFISFHDKTPCGPFCVAITAEGP